MISSYFDYGGWEKKKKGRGRGVKGRGKWNINGSPCAAVRQKL